MAGRAVKARKSPTRSEGAPLSPRGAGVHVPAGARLPAETHTILCYSSRMDWLRTLPPCRAADGGAEWAMC